MLRTIAGKGEHPRNEAGRARRRRWSLAAVAVLLAGLSLSAAAGLLWRDSERRHERQTFQSTASNVTATLSTLLRRDADFVGTLRALLSVRPQMSATGFDTYYSALAGRSRQVGAIGSAVVSVVPASQLAAFTGRRDRDGTFRALLGKWLLPVPRGHQARYCLFSAGHELVPMNSLTASLVQQDWCQSTSEVGSLEAPLLQSAADAGEVVAMPVDVPWLHTTFLEAAVYRRGAPLQTVAQRRTATLGWVVATFDIPATIRRAIGRNRGLSVALYHTNPGQSAELLERIGPSSPSGQLHQSTSLSIEGNWTVSVQGHAPVAGMSADAQGAVVFAAGTMITLLVLLLTRSRGRALELVAQKTGQLRHQALHDPLTGLPNRTLALDRAEQMLARARRTQTAAAALYVDLDEFKHVNDTLGHPAGDELLTTVAERLQSVIRESDTASRLAGDEFVVLLDGSGLDAAPELVAERMLEVLREPYELQSNVGSGRPVSLTASIGIAHGMHDNAEQMLANADVAMYAAKYSGKDRYVVFESGMQTAAQDRLTLEMDLADALSGEQLFLLYQPTFDLGTQRPIGAEALLRWQHPSRGVIAPDQFIPIAEDTGLIVPIGGWVISQACQQAASWREHGHQIGISVNVSARQLDSDQLLDDVSQALSDSGLDPTALTLEITETTLMLDAHATAKRLNALKQLGVRIAIDDFGTGYSSLAYLRHFRVDALKIDRSFINGISTSNQSAALIHTLVRLGKTLEIETLAEGIEDRAQLHALQLEHCDQGQGFLFARPLDVDQLEEFLQTWSTRRASTFTTTDGTHRNPTH